MGGHNLSDITPRWLSFTEACKYASMSPNTLMRYVPHSIYGTKKGGKWYIDRLSIDDWMNKDSEEIEVAVARLRGKVA